MPKPTVYNHNDTTARDALILPLLQAGRSRGAIVRETGIPEASVRRAIARFARRGISPGLPPMAPIEGMHITKTTTMVNAEGKVVAAWPRWNPTAEAQEEVVTALCERVAGKAPKLPNITVKAQDLLLELPIPDHHMGMLSWARETGADYDCAIATRLLTNGIRSVLADVPPVQEAVMVVLGDYYHSDNRSGMTERGGHVLDTDSRYARRLDAGIAALCDSIELVAAHAQTVRVVIISGNHDWHSAKWLSRVLHAYYRDQKRVLVSIEPTPRHYVKWGRVLLAYMHGDTMKAAQFARVIPAEAAEAWADSAFRFGRVGHWHHRSTEEYPGIVVETLPTLAAPDAYATEHGFLSRRAITACLWHRQYGLRSKMERCPEEIDAMGDAP